MATGESRERPTKVGRLVIIGIGNRDRGDDAAGLIAAEALREKVPNDVVVEVRDGEASRLIDAWTGAKAVILIDAVSSGSRPGTLHQIDARENPVSPDLFQCSTHSFGVAEAIGLAITLGKLPPVVWIFGIEGGDFNIGSDVSDEVRSVIGTVTTAVLDKIKKLTSTNLE